MPGLQSEPVYDTLSLELKVGERLLLFTDGLFEGAYTGPGRNALEQELLSTVRRGTDASLADLADALMGTFRAAAGDSPKDDATAILLEPAPG